MKFLIDNNLSRRLSRALNELDDDHEVVHLQDRFERSTPDEQWMSSLGCESNWVWLLCDGGFPPVLWVETLLILRDVPNPVLIEVSRQIDCSHLDHAFRSV